VNGGAAFHSLGAPATRALAAYRCSTLADVARHTRREIARLHGMGPKALGRLDDQLAAAGLRFADDS